MKASFLILLASLACLVNVNAKGERSVQTLGYPAKKPLVSFNVPKDWKAEQKGDSLFILSPDGGDVIVEVLNLAAGVDDDEAAIKEAEDTVNQDFKKLNFKAGQSEKSNGLLIGTLTSKGVDKHGEALINFLLMFAQYPKAALEKHADNLEMIIRSIKVR